MKVTVPILLLFLFSCKESNPKNIPAATESTMISTIKGEKVEENVDSLMTNIDTISTNTDSTSNNMPLDEKEISVKETKRVKSKAEISFNEILFQSDTIIEGDVIKHNFEFINKGKDPLKIYKTEVSCGCTVPSFPFLDIAPDESGFIGVTYNSVGKSGMQNPEIKVFTNTKDSPITLKLSVFVKNQE
jgi:hypothetical protein